MGRYLRALCIVVMAVMFWDNTARGQQKDSAQPVKTVPEDSVNPEKIYEGVDEWPEPPGGTEAFYAYLSKHIKMPKKAVVANAQGIIYINIVISKDGSITDVKVRKDPVGYGCAEEAIRVLKKMPRWKPGKLKGVIVAVRYSVPIKFVVRD